MEAQIDAREIPVFPEVGSITVEPCLRTPFFSAFSIIDKPILSFTDDSGKNIDIDVKDLDKTPGEEAIHKQKIMLVRKFVSKLPEKYENLIKYRYFDELSYNEIAEKTQAPLGTIKAQLFRARELLFEILKDKKSQI